MYTITGFCHISIERDIYMFLFGNPRSRHPSSSSLWISPYNNHFPSISFTHTYSLVISIFNFSRFCNGSLSCRWSLVIPLCRGTLPCVLLVPCSLPLSISSPSPAISHSSLASIFALLTSYPDSRILFYCLFSGPLAMGICRLQPPPRYHHYHHHHHYHQHRHQPSRHHAGKRS